jgi:uncharacterized protein (DUF952 family)
VYGLADPIGLMLQDPELNGRGIDRDESSRPGLGRIPLYAVDRKRRGADRVRECVRCRPESLHLRAGQQESRHRQTDRLIGTKRITGRARLDAHLWLLEIPRCVAMRKRQLGDHTVRRSAPAKPAQPRPRRIQPEQRKRGLRECWRWPGKLILQLANSRRPCPRLVRGKAYDETLAGPAEPALCTAAFGLADPFAFSAAAPRTQHPAATIRAHPITNSRTGHHPTRARTAARPRLAVGQAVCLRSTSQTTGLIFHIAFLRDWHSAAQEGSYRMSTRGLTLDEVGFIHAGFEHQVATVGSALFGDATEPVVVLVIDTERLDVPVVVENFEGGDESFPHIYGALPTHAVVDVRPASMAAGRFRVEDRGHA